MSKTDLQRKADKVILLAKEADNKLKGMKSWNEDGRTETKFTDREIEITDKASRRLWAYWIKLDTRVKMELC